MMINVPETGNWLLATVTVKATIESVWKCWTDPVHIVEWNSPSPEWITRKAANDCRPGGKFRFEMAMTDGSLAFDYAGVYETVLRHQQLSLVQDDNRHTIIRFTGDVPVTITEHFEADRGQDAAMQQAFCQLVLDHFKSYVENNFLKKNGAKTF